MKAISVGLLGIGTVGGGTWNVLARNQEEITRRAGRGICITKVADKDLARAKQLVADKAAVTADAYEVVNDPDIDIVVETDRRLWRRPRSGAQGDRERQARGHRQQGAPGDARQRDLRRGAETRVMLGRAPPCLPYKTGSRGRK